MEEQRELTVLFYFASDNPLAPLVVSELKAIKDAGFQRHTNVLVYFDPMEPGAPTQLLDVNHKRKESGGDHIGDGNDPFVRNMREDDISDQIQDRMNTGLKSPDEVSAVNSLTNFIKFALEQRPAKNYMLFLVGHGMIVGNDAFLPDDHPVSAITLVQLKEICENFKNGPGQLQLLGLHSCSMSSVEVAYQLKGQAKYLLATQGTSFVNGWPYRQLMKKMLNQVKRVKDAARAEAESIVEEGKRIENAEKIISAVDNATVDYDQLIRKLFFLCLFNFTDFMTAGYSCDLALCRLDKDKLEGLQKPLQELVASLKAGLTAPVPIFKDLILLAHWEAQSFWSESYTDLWDFCDCLAKRCTAEAKDFKDQDDPIAKLLGVIVDRCGAVQKILESPDLADRSNALVRHAENFGSKFQYAHGLSIYFPWCEPLDDQRATFESEQDGPEQQQREAPMQTVLEKYREYDFTRDFGADSWLSFLELYFGKTKRLPRFDFADGFITGLSERLRVDPVTAADAYRIAKETFFAGVLKRTPELEKKRTPEEGPDDCTCPTIKNYPIQPFRPNRVFRQFSITPGALRVFLPVSNESGMENNGDELEE